MEFTISDVKYITSKRGRTLLVMGGYTYSLVKTTMNNKINWRCSTHNSKGCHAKLATVQGTVICINTYHNHKAGVINV